MLKLTRRNNIEPRDPESDNGEPQKTVSDNGILGRLRLPDDPDQFRATLVEHLEELRIRIFRSLGIVGVAWLAGWFFEKPAFGWLSDLVLTNVIKSVKDPSLVTIAFQNNTEPFMLKLRLSFMIGLIMALPFVVLQLWGFVRPGLKPSERRPIERVAPFSVLLFAMGVGFCVSILGPCTRWFSSYLEEFPNAHLIQDPAPMISFCLKMMLAFGLGFQLPLVVYALGAVGLLSAETLQKYWRQAAFGIFVLAAAFTPSNDAFSMLMMAVPMVALFMISVWAVKLTQRKQKISRADLEQ